jgi:hypothetical protein
MIGFMTSRRGIMLVSKECWERGCSCYDDRVDKDPVLIAAAIARKEKEVVKRQWVGLTAEEINAIYIQHHNQFGECLSGDWGYERDLEAKLKEKNT